jgi:hypothetical protein
MEIGKAMTGSQPEGAERLQAWRDFTLGFWNSTDMGLDPMLQRRLFLGGFFPSRWSLYDLQGRSGDVYLNDYEVRCLEQANARYQAVLNDRVLLTHVMANFFRVANQYCVVFERDVQWLAMARWLEQDHVAELCIHPVSPGPSSEYWRVRVQAQRYIGSLGEGPVDELVSAVQALARKNDCAYVIESGIGPENSPFIETAGQVTPALLQVLLVRDLDSWESNLVAASLLLHGQPGQEAAPPSLERGALSVSVNPFSGKLGTAAGLDSQQHLQRYTSHPVTGLALTGLKIPQWQQLRDQLLGFFDESSYLRICNITLALTADGPMFFAASGAQVEAYQVHQPLMKSSLLASHLGRLAHS